MRAIAIVAALICGAFAGLVVGVLIGVAVPDEVLPPGAAALVLALAGAVGMAVLVGRLLPTTRRRGGTPDG